MISCTIVPASSSSGISTHSTAAPSELSSSTAARAVSATSGSARSKSASTTPMRSPSTPPPGRRSLRDRLEQERAVLGAPRDGADGVERPRDTGTTPSFGTRPIDGRSPVTPQKQAGMRTEPAVSVPSVPAARSAAAAAPLPPLEPPQIRSSDHGLCAGPKCGLVVIAPYANSCVLSLPSTIAPARRSRATGCGIARGDVLGAGSASAAVVGVPATSITSLTATGTPCSGPGAGASASASASSARTEMYALSSPSSRLDPVEVRLQPPRAARALRPADPLGQTRRRSSRLRLWRGAAARSPRARQDRIQEAEHSLEIGVLRLDALRRNRRNVSQGVEELD